MMLQRLNKVSQVESLVILGKFIAIIVSYLFAFMMFLFALSVILLLVLVAACWHFIGNLLHPDVLPSEIDHSELAISRNNVWYGQKILYKKEEYTGAIVYDLHNNLPTITAVYIGLPEIDVLPELSDEYVRELEDKVYEYYDA